VLLILYVLQKYFFSARCAEPGVNFIENAVILTHYQLPLLFNQITCYAVTLLFLIQEDEQAVITLENVHEFTGSSNGHFSPAGSDTFTVNVVSSYAARGASEGFIL
jgi:hypothetical protein